jgi:hypothetical protein
MALPTTEIKFDTFIDCIPVLTDPKDDLLLSHTYHL